MSSARRLLWAAGAPARTILISAIRGYRAVLSGWLGGQCRFYPSCSHYAEDAIQSHGAVKGTAFATWRLLRCNPFGAGGVDYAPPGHDSVYEDVIPSRRASGSREADA